MASLLEIETAIKNLSENDVRELSVWLQDYLAEQWDQQIAHDCAAGKLDQLIAQTEAAIVNNQIKELNAVLHDS
jgi:hypothetical protein